MPQLDKFSFIPQIWWLIFVFLPLYFFLFQKILPELAAVSKSRFILLNYLKIELVTVTDAQLGLETKYDNNVSNFVIQTHYILVHFRSLLDKHLIVVNLFIKNYVNF